MHEPDLSALSFRDQTWSYAQFQTEIERTCHLLLAQGLQRGDRVAYVGLNHPCLLIVFFAVTRLGGIFVPLNFRLTAPELKFIINDAGVRVLIAADSHCDMIDSVRTQLSCKAFLNVGLRRPCWDEFDSSIRVPPISEFPDYPDPLDVAAIIYTSGTTGSPKGAMLTHENIWTASVNLIVTVGFGGSDVSLNCAPLFHVGGLCVVVLPILLAGGHVILQETFDPGEFMRAIEEHRITVAFGVPAMMNAMVHSDGFSTFDLSSLRLLIAGGASVPESLLRQFANRNIPVSQGWGMTESAATGTFLAPTQAHLRLGSCGKPAMLCDCKVVDYSLNLISEPGVKGELCIRGANIMKGYWNRPEATAEVIDEDGWYYSGDVGYFDADGYFYVCDRIKDMVITGGENVYPAEIEGVLREHPSVEEIAVIGASDPTWGERVVAVVVLKRGAKLTLDDLTEFARPRLASYKRPRELRLIDLLPRNPSGKVLKSVLRAALQPAEMPASGPATANAE